MLNPYSEVLDPINDEIGDDETEIRLGLAIPVRYRHRERHLSVTESEFLAWRRERYAERGW